MYLGAAALAPAIPSSAKYDSASALVWFTGFIGLTVTFVGCGLKALRLNPAKLVLIGTGAVLAGIFLGCSFLNLVGANPHGTTHLNLFAIALLFVVGVMFIVSGLLRYIWRRIRGPSREGGVSQL
jgi:hypothetical protein